MELQNKYFYFTSALSTKFCDDVINYSLSKKIKTAVVGNKQLKEVSRHELKDIKKNIRNSKINWINDPWVYREISPYVKFANEAANWNFDYDWMESIQITNYSKKQYYHWHVDSFPEPFINKDKNHNGKIRKISMTCQLSDPKDYEGGELEFAIPEVDKGKLTYTTFSLPEILPKGSIVVFPSFVWHRVKPVTKGVRKSLVSWTIGRPFN